MLHFGIIAEGCAAIRAGFADLGAYPAGTAVKNRSADHKISAGLADFRAVHQQPDMLGLGMLSPLLQTVRDRLETNLRTGLAIPNALLHSFTAMHITLLYRVIHIGF
ncbi:MAG: hypothetical protein AAGU05_01885 [Anaerolineaceae bacterium]